MTAGATLTKPVDGPADRVPEVPSGRPGPSSRQIPWMRILQWLGVLVPLGIMVRYAAGAAPAFDGAMNLQVAENLSHGLGYVREYGGTVLFPSEIQTSGFYIFLAAGLIKVFGATTFVYELPNLIALAGLLITVNLGLRRWPVLRILGPSIVLFCVPGMVENSTHGYGEYVVAPLVIGAFVLVGAAATGMRRPVLTAGLAWVLVGIAFTIKVIALLAVPVLIVGIIGLALARPAINRWKLTASVLFAAIPVGIVELQRLLSFGSVSKYVQFWKDQITNAGAQAGVSTGGAQGSGTGLGSSASPTAQPSTPILQKIADHIHLMSQPTNQNGTGLNAVILVLVLGLPFVVLIGLFLARGESWRTWLARPAALASVMLATYAGGYLVWFLAITPTSKTWVRRIVIALVAIAFLYVLLIGMAKDRWNARSRVPSTANPRRRTVIATAWIVLATVGFLCVLPGITTANTQINAVSSSGDSISANEAQIKQLATAADQLSARGDTLYGNGWWSAPVVALYGDLPLGDLSETSYCSPDILAGKAYLIWDFYAVRIASPQSGPNKGKPGATHLIFTPVPDMSNSYGGIWKISLNPKFTCPVK